VREGAAGLRREGALGGTVRIFLGEALAIPTGLLTAAFLTRRLGPDVYGLFALAATIVAWVSWSLGSVFARSTVKLVAQAHDWRPAGAVVLRAYLAVGLFAGGVLALLARPIADLLGEPALASGLRLFALDVPLFGLAHAHRNILVGTGGFTARAKGAAARWTARLVLIVALVGAGLSLTGAILGSIGASLVEIAVCRRYVRPPLRGAAPLALRDLVGYALPLLFAGLSLRVFDRLDLLALKALGGSAAQAGFYGAAQSAALLPGIFAVSFSPLVLSTLARALHEGREPAARALARDALRVAICLLPFAALISGAAPEVTTLVFGERFLPAARPLGLLIFAAMGLVLLSVSTAILVALGRPGLTLSLTAPLPLLALGGHLALIPRLGMLGAALVTTGFAALAAGAGLACVRAVWEVAPSAATLARSALLSALAYGLAASWPTPGVLVLLKLGLAGAALPLAFAALRELRADDLARARGLLRLPSASG
jgi:O-antigen/teichoic acid export membrane protein